MNLIKASYRVKFPTYGVIQTVNLISHEDYVNVYIPMLNDIKEKERQVDETNKKKHKDLVEQLTKEIAELKRELKAMVGKDFFTDRSPLWLSQENDGFMQLPEYQGGNIRVILEKF